MERNDIQRILSGDIEALQLFIAKFSQTFSFAELDYMDKRKDLWNVLFINLSESSSVSSHSLCLSAIKILSRDKAHLNELITESRLETLLRLAGLDISENFDITINQITNSEIIIEALKCLCNVIYNSQAAQKMCSKNNATSGIVRRLRTYRDPDIPHDIKFFDMKLLFLITALNAEVRPHLKDELHGLTYLTETLDLILKEDTTLHEHITEGCFLTRHILSDNQVLLSCEILKVLFNLTVRSSDATVDEEEETHFTRLVSVLRDLLLAPTHSVERKVELHGHVVNLLTAIPSSCFDELVPRISTGEDISKDMEFDNHNMEAVFILLKFLKTKLEALPSVSGQQDLLSPILTVLARCSRSVRVIRKYLRMQVLPPLKEVHKRPEQGDTLRNYLCRLLTTPITHVRDLAADFLFVLCKENVERMIKYTGYGNAAGLFATRGLMGGKSVEESLFSSESEDSDTEVYKEYRHGINPVVGCYEPPRPNPLVNMTEEQKEYEAMQLVNLMDKLTRSGTIKPCRVGEDGRPEPVEHVLQLQDELPRQQLNRRDSD